MNRLEENGFDGIRGCVLLKGARRVVSPHALPPGLFRSADAQGTQEYARHPAWKPRKKTEPVRPFFLSKHSAVGQQINSRIKGDQILRGPQL